MAQDHFERHGHTPDIVDWNFNVVFDGQPAVAEMAQAYETLFKASRII